MKDSSNSDGDPITPEGDGLTQEELPSGDADRRAKSEEADPAPHQDASLIAGETLQQVGASSTGEFPGLDSQTSAATATGRHAFLVGAGILISRIVGLIRQRIFAHYFGNSGAGDAFTAAFRIPNFLQNVFGEGALSASFIPVYASCWLKGDEKEAGKSRQCRLRFARACYVAGRSWLEYWQLPILLPQLPAGSRTNDAN